MHLLRTGSVLGSGVTPAQGSVVKIVSSIGIKSGFPSACSDTLELRLVFDPPWGFLNSFFLNLSTRTVSETRSVKILRRSKEQTSRVPYSGLHLIPHDRVHYSDIKRVFIPQVLHRDSNSPNPVLMDSKSCTSET